jgi:hypothetical protein
MLLAYFGPETVLPITSAIAGAAGVLMMFGRGIFRAPKRLVLAATRFLGQPRPETTGPLSRPAGRRIATRRLENHEAPR